MIKNRYKAYGKNINEEIFNGTCIAESIIGAINLFNDNYLSVEKIEKVQQVSRDSRIGIELVNINKSSEENKFKVNMNPENKGNRVYITFSNEFHPSITGVYANEELAEKEATERQDMVDCIENYEVKGSRKFDHSVEIYDLCKYFKPRIETIRKMISTLYDLDNCCCGGIAHVVIDDNNYQDHHLKYVISECSKEENRDREEIGIAKLICEELLKLSIQERALLFSSYYSYRCDGNCKNCLIEKGNYIDE